MNSKMKKYLFLGFSLMLVLLSGCKSQGGKDELSNYYLSLTSSEQVKEDEVSVVNQVYDFETDSTKTSEPYTLTSQYSLAVYDQKDNAILYTVKDSGGKNDQVFKYDIKSKKTEQLTDFLWGINYIIPRENDYIVVGVPFESKILSLYSIDRKTKKAEHIAIPDEKHDDMSVWQVAYIPQTGDVVIQTYSDSEQYKLTDKWNSSSEDHQGKDLIIPFYHYIYRDHKVKYLFEEDMPQSFGLVSNGKQILIAINSQENGDSLLKYDLEQSKLEKVEKVNGLGRVFYLDNASQYLYAFNNGIVRKDINTGKEEWLDSTFKDSGYYNNFILLRK